MRYHDHAPLSFPHTALRFVLLSIFGLQIRELELAKELVIGWQSSLPIGNIRTA